MGALRTIRYALRAADWIGQRVAGMGRSGAGAARPPGQGISIIIPERENPALLRECLRSVRAARARVEEPVEVIVVVSGSPEAAYSDLVREDDSVRWLFSPKPLWFSGAVRLGLRAARHGWVYLLNNDMVADSSALCSLLPWRAPNVFAIASQIHFKDAHKRREETGWTRFRRGAGPMEIEDAIPDDGATIRGNFYAGGGASLFQRDLLRKMARSSSVYDPFYWEDVEWGTRAWRRGYQTLFCPASQVWHEHRATNRKFFEEAEINRIQKRNRVVYHLRNHLGEGSIGEAREIRDLLDPRTLREILRPSRALAIVGGRIGSCFLPLRDVPLEYTWHKYYPRPFATPGKPMVLMVTPYAAYPPAHGGARRIQGLLEGLSEQFDIVLLSDEIDAYSGASTKYFPALASIHLMGGRPGSAGAGRIDRIRNHSHKALVAQLRFLLASCRPAVVQIEYVELCRLAAQRSGPIPWFLTLHDVLLSGDGRSLREDRYEIDWMRRYDALIACSEEDARLLPPRNVVVVPNGTAVTRRSASPDRPSILFAGPFRYAPNLDGIQEFLRLVYERLRARVAGLELWILGGHGAPAAAARLEGFDQPGVRVLDYVERPEEWLERCALTINPLRGVRGSCIKVIESVAAGRVCVSTRDGARGFAGADFSSLIVVEKVRDFAEPLERLLVDHEYRRSIEFVPPASLAPFSWAAAAKLQANLYFQWMNKSPIASNAGS